ncbi:LysR family transcriptional regulator [Aestuariicoccus sp. MJ-SS9]|uniref:LysR family transcriptional regulator n=1 Tax=Aestuariicoccus sp. MJ-SS9 TaxID=3079855 RepID=UPI002906E970|nr:LysR family transcriptional regulator [Aestuariicoccus sp. MJ-SS9]MDU8914181.1 LysR family transcriptional regulator [Aestuariicoccus sp. MJ-SS9]
MNTATNMEMRAFVVVVEQGSFTGAARILGLTPSAVSKLVGRLEDQLGVRLLHRTTRRLSMTSEGELYFPRAQEILAAIEEVEAEVAGLHAEPRGHLHVSNSTGFGVHQIAPILPEFLRLYPRIQLELTATDRVVDLVSEHADVTLRAGTLPDTTLAAMRIATYGRTICASPAYLERHGVPRHPADLAEHACIVFTTPTARVWPFQIEEDVVKAGIKPIMVTDSSDMVLRLGLEGAGIIRLGDIMVADHIRKGQLVPLLTDCHQPQEVPIHALYEAGRYRLPKVRVFLDFLIRRFSDPPWAVRMPGTGD